MRKFSLALLALLMAAAMVSAAPIGTEWTLEAEASATFGVNLDTVDDAGTGANADGPTTGFALENDIDLEITFIEEQTTEFGEGQMYGYIEIDEFELGIKVDAAEKTNANAPGTDDDGNDIIPTFFGTNGEITAKVFLGPAYIILTAGNDVDIAGDVGLNVDESILGSVDSDSDGTSDILFNNVARADAGNSVGVGFDLQEMVNVELIIASVGGVGGTTTAGGSTDADDTWAGNTFNNYHGALYTETTLDMITVSLDAGMPLRTHGPKASDPNDTESKGDTGDNAFLAVGVEYEMPLSDVMTAKPYVGVDLFNDATAEAFDIEFVAGANITWGADDLEVFDAVSDETEEGVGIEVGYLIDNSSGDATDNGLWVRVGVAESDGDDGFLPVIGGAALVEFATIDGDSFSEARTAWAFGAEVSADLGEIKPYFGLMTADVEDFSGNDSGMTIQLGTDINIIPATTFTVEYSSGDLNKSGDGVYDTNQFAYAAAVGAATSKTGTFTIKTKVEY